ncbi:MAG TPA: TlpA disulfide reductase family protein [Pirellulales bacterium]|jgi:thiol-disulfide isomerase/thioredoxin|nr:TlpA disulfide reductase family protein [Pirellulales bacterium]
MDESDRDLPQAPPNLGDRPSPRWMWVFLAAALVFLYLKWSGNLGAPHASGGEHTAVGRRLPSLHLEALTGDSQDVTLADLEGKVTVINFWATWCGYCIEELPEIVTLPAQFRDQPDFHLLLVSCNNEDAELGELREKTKEFLAQKQLQLPTYADQSEQTRRVVAMTLDKSSFGFPTTIVLDRAGVIRGVWTGYEQGIGDQLKQLVSELLKK